MRKHFSAGGILLNPENKIYLIHELERDEWALPKGTIEQGETPLEAAQREIGEETGYKDFKVISDEAFFINRYVTIHHGTGEPLDKTVHLFIFKTALLTQTKTKEMEDEGLEGAWFTFEDALKQITHEEQKKAIERARELSRF